MSVKTELFEALQNIKAPGSFAGFQPFSTAPPDCIWVNDVGHIPMPLTEDKAQEIIAKCIQAPFGKGSETIVDTSVRNT